MPVKRRAGLAAGRLIFAMRKPSVPRQMSFLYEKVLRPGLFALDSEKAHEFGVSAMALLGRITPVCRVM